MTDGINSRDDVKRKNKTKNLETRKKRQHKQHKQHFKHLDDEQNNDHDELDLELAEKHSITIPRDSKTSRVHKGDTKGMPLSVRNGTTKGAPLQVIVKTIVVHERDVEIYKCSQSIQMRFLRRLFTINFTQFAFVLALTYTWTKSAYTPQLILDHSWLTFVFLGIVVLVFIIYFVGRYEAWSLASQIVVLILTTLTITAALCVLSGFFDAMLFVRATSVLAFVIFSLAILTMQPCFCFSTILSCVYVVVMCVGALFILVYQPHQSFFTNPTLHSFISPPKDALDMFKTLMLGMFGSLYYIYGIHKQIAEKFPDQYLCSAYYVFGEGIYSMFILVRASNYICPGRGGGGALDRVIDAGTLFV